MIDPAAGNTRFRAIGCETFQSVLSILLGDRAEWNIGGSFPRAVIERILHAGAKTLQDFILGQRGWMVKPAVECAASVNRASIQAEAGRKVAAVPDLSLGDGLEMLQQAFRAAVNIDLGQQRLFLPQFDVQHEADDIRQHTQRNIGRKELVDLLLAFGQLRQDPREGIAQLLR